MSKFEKNNLKIIIPIIIFLISIIGLLYHKYNNSYEDYYSNDEFVLYGTQENIMRDKNVQKNKIVIHIMGEVENEGIVEIDEGARIVDAVNAAGGFTEYADITKVNLAYIIKDGIKIIIPSINDENELDIVSDNSGENIIVENMEISNNDIDITKININTATQEQLQTLTGIGESTAKKIIDYRNQNGFFSDIEDIKNVSGIGESKFNSIKAYITI